MVDFGVFVIGNRVFAVATIDYRQFNLHSVGNYVLNENGGTLTDLNIGTNFRESGKIRSKLDKNSVVFNRTNDSCGGIPRSEF